MRKYKITILVGVCILVMLLMPVSGVSSGISIPNLDKVLHAGMFGFLTCVYLIEKYVSEKEIGTSMSPILIIGTYAVITEILQKVSGYRSFDILDIAADFTGIMLGYLMIYGLSKLRNSR